MNKYIGLLTENGYSNRRLKWWCKLAHPKINTQQTKFIFVHSIEWVIPFIPNAPIITAHEAGQLTERVIYYRNQLKYWIGHGRKTNTEASFAVAYCEPLDICMVYFGIGTKTPYITP